MDESLITIKHLHKSFYRDKIEIKDAGKHQFRSEKWRICWSDGPLWLQI